MTVRDDVVHSDVSVYPNVVADPESTHHNHSDDANKVSLNKKQLQSSKQD